MKPASFDLPITRDDDFILPLNFKTQDTDLVRTAVDFTGYTFESKLNYKDGTSSAITVTVISAATGSIKLVISRVTTAALPSSGTKWYLAVTDPSGSKQTYLDGNVFPRERGSRQR